MFGFSPHKQNFSYHHFPHHYFIYKTFISAVKNFVCEKKKCIEFSCRIIGKREIVVGKWRLQSSAHCETCRMIRSSSPRMECFSSLFLPPYRDNHHTILNRTWRYCWIQSKRCGNPCWNPSCYTEVKQSLLVSHLFLQRGTICWDKRESTPRRVSSYSIDMVILYKIGGGDMKAT